MNTISRGDIVSFNKDSLQGVGVVVGWYASVSYWSIRIEAYACRGDIGGGHQDDSEEECCMNKKYWNVDPSNIQIIKTVEDCPSYARSIRETLYPTAYNL